MDLTDLELAKILVELPDLISQSECRHRFPSSWGAKKRRSCPYDDPALPAVPLPSLPLPPPPLPQAAPETSTAPEGHSCEAEKPNALSPSSPLSLSPSESDDKSKHCKRKISLKRKREDSLQKIDELSQCRDQLQEEIKNVKRYYDQLKTINLELNARKQKLALGVHKENPQIQSSTYTTVTEFDRPIVQIGVQNQQPLTAESSQSQRRNGQTQTMSFLGPSTSGMGMVNDNVGPVAGIDLNVAPVEESMRWMMMMNPGQPFNLDLPAVERSALAAQARQRRIKICRSKNLNSVSKPRYPVCR